MRLRAAVLALTACSLAFERPARADDTHELRHDVATDAVVTVTSFVLIIGAELRKDDIAPLTCKWCDDDLNGLDRGARDALVWKNPRTAAHLSDAIGALAAPAANFGTLILASADAGAGHYAGVDSLLLVEALGVSGVANEFVKLTVGRERPFVHAMPPWDKPRTSHSSDNNLSFYSGHTSSTFALAAAGGTIATLRGYRLAPLVFATGGVIGAFTGYLRIAADKHYLTDVLFGAIIGSAIGIGVPVLFHGRRTEETHASPFPPATGTVSTASLVSFGGGF